jgi:hypothetical protein
MGRYAGVKKNKIVSFLRWLNKQEGFEIVPGGKHYYNVKYRDWKRPHPISFKHNIMMKSLVISLMKKVVETGVCTQDEFDKRVL